jgi:hypothetical protein
MNAMHTSVSCLFLSSNPGMLQLIILVQHTYLQIQFNACTKHIEIGYHFVRERVVSSKGQIVDDFTKDLSVINIDELKSNLNLSRHLD